MPPAFTDLQGGFELGPWTVIPDRGLLRQGSVKVHLEPMVMDVLMVLASHQGSVVTQDQLVDAVWEGRFVGNDVIVAKIATLRQKLGDQAKDPTYIETVPRRGYRLMMAVTLPEAPEAEVRAPRFMAVTRGILIAGLGVVAAAIYMWWPKAIDSLSVLEFECLSNQLPKVEHICAAFNTELPISLQDPKLEVTRGPDQNVDADVVGKLSFTGNRIHVKVSIILANGTTKWASNFDGSTNAVFDLQARVATALRGVLLGESGPPAPPASRPANPAADAEYALGLFFLAKRGFASLIRAQGHFEKTIEYDARFGPAYLRLAITHLLLSDFSTDSRQDRFDQSIEVLNRGVQADPSIREAAEVVKGFVFHQYGNWVAAIAAYETALGGKTIYPITYHWHSRLVSALGFHDRSLDQARKALAMNPASQVLNSRVANAYLWINDMPNARQYFEQANSMGIGAPIHHFGYTMLLLRDGRVNEARDSVKHALQLFSANYSWVDPVFDFLLDPNDQEMKERAYLAAEQMMVDDDAAPYIRMIVWALFGEADRVMAISMQVADSGKLYEHESAQIEIIYLDELKLLRDHKDFPMLLKKLGLIDYWASIGCQWANDQVTCN